MVFITLIALGITAYAAAQAAQDAKDQAAYGKATTEISNKAAMANYRRNLEKFSERRVETRKAALIVQADISSKYITAANEFAGSFADNWGQSAELYARSIAQLAGEDTEQIRQNAERELEFINEAQESARLDLTTQLKAAPPDASRKALIQGLITTGFAVAKLPSEIQIAKDQQQIRDFRVNQAVRAAGADVIRA